LKNSEVLRKAANVIRSYGWTSHENGDTEKGFCTVGAIGYVIYGRPFFFMAEVGHIDQVASYVVTAVGKEKEVTKYGLLFSGVNCQVAARWNDSLRSNTVSERRFLFNRKRLWTTEECKQEVIDTLERAAAIAEVVEEVIVQADLTLVATPGDGVHNIPLSV
jgi:hypothetical protein